MIATRLILVAALLLPGANLLAVSEAGKPLAPSLPVDKRQKLSIPVAWQMTKSSFRSASSLTESYREVWTLMMGAHGKTFLSSPRATVPVFGATDFSETGATPNQLIMDEADFAKLVGVVNHNTVAAMQRAGVAASDRLVSIKLRRSPALGETLVLQVGDEALFRINMKVETAF